MKYKMLCLAVIASFNLYANHDTPKERRKSPPPEALEACQDKNENDPVTFVGRRGENLEAICSIKDGQLVAVPNNHRRNKE